MFGNALFVSRASGTAVASSKASPHRDLDVRKLVGGFRAKQTQAWAQGATRRGQTCHTINCRPIMTSTGTRAPTSPIGGALGLTTTPSTALTLPCRPISHYSSPATTPFSNYESHAVFQLRIARGTVLNDGSFFAQVPSAGWHQARGCGNERLGGPRSETAPA